MSQLGHKSHRLTGPVTSRQGPAVRQDLITPWWQSARMNVRNVLRDFGAIALRTLACLSTDGVSGGNNSGNAAPPRWRNGSHKRKGLEIPRASAREGSSPSPGTTSI